MRYSVIVATNRNKEALKPLFVRTSKEAELIVIDSNYNSDTKEFLRHQTGYGSIVYAPVKKSPIRLKRDFAQALNTALLYADSDYIIRADDNLEFCPDFFSIVDEDIQQFEETTKGRFAIIGRKLWGSLGERKWQDNPNFPERYTAITNPKFTFSFGIYPRELMNKLNGYNELYDIGWAYEDVEFLHRILRLGYNVLFDKELLAYSYAHTPNRWNVDFTDKLYEMHAIEISFGRTWAYNPFRYEHDNIKYVAFREPYIVHGLNQFRIVEAQNNRVKLEHNGTVVNFNTYSPKNDFVSSWLHEVGYYELGLLREIEQLVTGGTFIDVGGYLGTHAIYFAKFCHADMVYVYEPDRKNFKMLKRNIEDNNLVNKIKPISIGLWSSIGTQRFYTGDDSNKGISKVRADGNTEIEVTTIDEEAKHLKNIGCIKIDVEGNELEVLNGAVQTIEKYRPVLAIEVHGTTMELPSWLVDLGYRYKKIRSGNMNHIVLESGLKHKGYLNIPDIIKFPI